MIDVNTEVIRRAQHGDALSISDLYERYHTSIFRYLYYRVGDRQTAEDLASEVFVRMLRFLSSFKPPSAAFQSWLFRIAKNLVADHFREMKTRQNMELEGDLEELDHSFTPPMEGGLTADTLRLALDRLSEEQRDVIVMRFVSEMPIAEVARSLNKSEDAVKGLQRRALITLRDALSEREKMYD